MMIQKRPEVCLLLGILLATIPVLLFVVPVLVGITILPHLMPPVNVPHMNYM